MTANIGSLPYELLVQIISQIDDKGDLDSLCLALPESAGNIITKYPKVLEKVYQSEIRAKCLLLNAVITFQYHCSTDIAALLRAIDPRTQANTSSRRTQEQALDEQRDSYFAHDEQSQYSYQRDEASVRIENALSCTKPEIISQMINTHVQVEKLSRIFIRYQFDAHQQTAKQAPASCGERSRVITAIYRTLLIVFMRLMYRGNFLGSIVDSGTREDERCVAYVNWQYMGGLSNAWSIWEVKEISAVVDVLWKEIPSKVIISASDGKIYRQGGWVIEKGEEKLNVNYPVEAINILFTEREWNLNTQVQFLECLGDRQKAEEFVVDHITRDPQAATILSGQQGSIGYNADITFRSNLIGRCEERIRSITQIKALAHAKSNTDHPLLSPRRLVKGDTGVLYMQTSTHQGLQKTVDWTAFGPVELRDCVWDDFRLEQLGYHFPELVQYRMQHVAPNPWVNP
ncbi:hypothetical protein H072_6994 [Dactylellina haptotyla CBS 200.50]|uniref:Uncharacterized protein n=1 Tax=Dactylellina haptotyla (strain CBS 200.50) TaxID=1284197 RepID=S8A8M1_DACHA|nr:hypothetical protein H072_6994 [Dactylellina haptotyla CBS 200.50]